MKRRFFEWRGFGVVLVGLAVVGVGLRLGFLAVGYPELTHDPASYYYNARALVETGELDSGGFWGPEYVGRFPYIYNYIWVLSVAMRVLGTGPAAAVVLNAVLSLVGAGLLFLLLRKIAGGRGVEAGRVRRVGWLAAVLWLVNPIEIAFGALPLPIVAVGTGLLAVLFFGYCLLNARGWRFWLYALIFGLVLGVANLFRPMMMVCLVALLIVFAYRVAKARGKLGVVGRSVAALLIACGCLAGVQAGALAAAERATGQDNLVYGSGWSLYLGSNYEAQGKWNEEDAATASEILAEVGGDFREQDRILRERAVERYGRFELADFPIHFWHKAAVLLTGPADSIGFELRNFDRGMRGAYMVAIEVYMLGVFGLMVVGVYRFYRAVKLVRRDSKRCRQFSAALPFVMMAGLVLLGIFGSNVLLTEAMERYLTTIIPPLLVFGLGACMLAAPGGGKVDDDCE